MLVYAFYERGTFEWGAIYKKWQNTRLIIKSFTHMPGARALAGAACVVLLIDIFN